MTDLLTEARGLIDRAEDHAASAVELLWRAGRILTEAKADTPYGQWLPRLEAAGITSQRASEAIRLARLGQHELPGTVRTALAAVATERQTPDASGVSAVADRFIDRVRAAYPNLSKSADFIPSMWMSACWDRETGWRVPVDAVLAGRATIRERIAAGALA